VVHLALKDHEHVTTESRGEDLRRKVVIVPKVKAPAPTTGTTPAVTTETAESANMKTESQPSSEPAIETGESVSSRPEPGNTIPKSPDVDDSIGNRV
jgi:hypothetical protein